MREHHYPRRRAPSANRANLVRRCRTQPAARECTVLQALVPNRDGPTPDAPRFQIRASSRKGGTHVVTGSHRCTFVCVVRPPSTAVIHDSSAPSSLINPERRICHQQFAFVITLIPARSPTRRRGRRLIRGNRLPETWPLSFGNLAFSELAKTLTDGSSGMDENDRRPRWTI